MTARPGSLPTIILTALLALAAPRVASAAAVDAKDRVATAIDARHDEYAAIVRSIWEFAEVGYHEVKTTALLQKTLRAAGFTVTTGLAGVPTSFMAEYGSGGPVIALLAEIDALPGFSQDAVPRLQPLSGKLSGHACGHHLFGTGSTAAAIAVRGWLESAGVAGRIRVYGTPAEEGGSGKVYMVREGVFDDVDVVLHWHPADRNDASPTTTLANKSAKFRFHGVSSHAAAAPERGRSALDGVEAMNHMINLMREHIPEQARIHYVITQGGLAPNVVPDFAEVYYYVRHPQVPALEDIWDRVVKAAEGAARGTGTQMDYEVIHGNHSLLPNDVLAKMMDSNLRRVGGVHYTVEEEKFAAALYGTLDKADRELGSEKAILPLKLHAEKGSTDVGDVSWVVPTVGLKTATWVPGTAAHSWQAVAAGGMSIGVSGMEVAAKTLAMTAMDLFLNPQGVKQAKQEFEKRRGKGYTYQALLGDRSPPLDYRD